MIKPILLLAISSFSVVWADQWEMLTDLQFGNRDVRRLSGESTAFHLAESTSGKQIAYVDHWTRIWVADQDGENKRELVNVVDSLNVFANPTWSPDDSFIVFSAGVGHQLSGGKTSLWMINVLSLKKKQLFASFDLDAFDETFPTWSPDGKKLAVNAIIDGKEELIVGDIFGDGSVSVIKLGMQKLGSISWSKNSDYILIQADSHDKGNLWLVNTRTFEKSVFDSGGIEVKYAEFSPDGKWVCLQSTLDGTTYILSSEGGQPTTVFDGELLGEATGLRGQNLGSKWSWDGNSLLATIVPQKMSERTLLGVVDTSGANFQVVFQPTLGHALDFRPEWSPDEKYIAFAEVNGDEAAIHSIDLTNQEKDKIVEGRHPTWSPYMDEIAFSRDGNIWVKNLETGIESQVTLNLEDASTPQWSPQGDVICFRNNGLWIVSSLGGEPSLFAEFGGAFNWSADGKRGWAHNNRSNIYNGIWGDTWEYLLEDAPQAGRIWGGSQGHVPYVASDGSFVVSFNWMEEGGIIIQRPDSQIGKTIFKEYDGLRPSWCTVSPSGSRIAFFLVEPWEREIWKIDISDLLADSVVP